MTITDNPCRYCVAPKRHIGCHSHCPEWAPIQEARDAERAAKEALGSTSTYMTKVEKERRTTNARERAARRRERKA